MLCMALLAAVVFFFPYYTTTAAVVVSFAVIGFLWMPQQSIIDSWIFDSSRALGKRYGFMRAWGSMGFATVALAFGGIINRFGWNTMFVGHALLSGMAIAAASRLKDSRRIREPEKSSGRAREPRQVNPLDLFRNTDYVFLLAASVFLFIPNRLAIQYMPELLRAVGGTPTHQGISMFVNAVSEVPILFTSAIFLAKIPALGLMAFASVFFTLRLLLLYGADSPMAVITASLCQGLSFGVFLPTIRTYINQVAPEHLKTSAQAIATAAYAGVSSVTGSFLGGYAIDTWGIKPTLLAGTILSALAMLTIGIQFLRRRQ